MNTIVIFGATGSVGVHTALRLREIGYNVIAVGKRGSDNGFFSDYGITYLSVDISDKKEFEKLPQSDIAQVLHFAGAMPARMKGYNPYAYIDSIITGTLNVLEYTRLVKAEKIIFTQSISDVLYLFGNKEPIPENAERKFPLTGDHSVYSISKNAAVNLIEHYYHQFGISRFILRLPTIYTYHPNPFYYVNGEKKWMGYRYLINRALKGEPIEIWGNPESMKEIVYVKDFVSIVENCVKSELDGGIYNVGLGTGVTLEDQIKIMIDIFCDKNKISEVIYKPEMPDSPQFILDASKTINELHFEPKYDYRSYLIDFKKEMETEPFKKLWGSKAEYHE